MGVSGINNQTTNTTSVTSNNNLTNKDVFLKILSAELSNQDPMSQQDDTQYIAQLAQFSSLEQSQNLNTTMTSLLASQNITEGSMLIGKNVQFANSDGSTTNAIVQGVIVNNGAVSLKTDNGTFDIGSVAGVGDTQDAQTGSTTTGA